ncbi:MAG: hypothetical protein MN733_36150, partial [Nitrososphaera sp.]|nr:hypothetical protein [Nitrososphaera sp.]
MNYRTPAKLRCLFIPSLLTRPERFRIVDAIVLSSALLFSSGHALAYTVRSSEVWCEQLKGVDLRKEFHTQHISYDDAAIRVDFVHEFRQGFLKQS